MSTFYFTLHYFIFYITSHCITIHFNKAVSLKIEMILELQSSYNYKQKKVKVLYWATKFASLLNCLF